MNTQHGIGSFQIISGEVRVTDPCYDEDTWCTAKLSNVKNGRWNAAVIKSDEGNWGMRVAVLRAVHENSSIDVLNFDTQYGEEIPQDIGVDSGQAGIFDTAFFKKDYPEPYAEIGTQEYETKSFAYQRAESIKTFKEAHKTTPTKESDAFIKVLEERPPYIPELTFTQDWYEICCDKTLSNLRSGVVAGGCVSSSGYGDGGYRCRISRDKDNQIEMIQIIFIGNNEKDSEENIDDSY